MRLQDSHSGVLFPPEVLHHGVKSFWKVRLNVDVTLIKHLQFSCIEIVSFLLEHHHELSRLYIDYNNLLSFFDPDFLKERIEERKEKLMRLHKHVDDAQLTKEVTENNMCQYLLDHLQLYQEGSEAQVLLVPSQGGLDPLISKPNDLQPYFVENPKQVRFTSNDVQHVLHSLQEESAELRKARRLAQLAVSYVDVFKQNIVKKVQYEKALTEYSLPRIRWMNAIRRVLILHQVEHMRMMLGLPPSLIYLTLHDDPCDTHNAEDEQHPHGLPRISSQFRSSSSRYHHNHRHTHHKVSYLTSSKEQPQQQLFPATAGDPLSPPKRVFLTSHDAVSETTPTLLAMETSYTTPPKPQPTHSPLQSIHSSNSMMSGSSSTTTMPPTTTYSPPKTGLYHHSSLPSLTTSNRTTSPFSSGMNEQQQQHRAMEHIPSLAESYHVIAEQPHFASSLPATYLPTHHTPSYTPMMTVSLGQQHHPVGHY